MRRRVLLFLAMLVAVAVVAFSLYLDASREESAALADFARRASRARRTRRRRARATRTGGGDRESGGASLVLVGDSTARCAGPTARRRRRRPLAAAIAHGDRTVILTRSEAAAHRPAGAYGGWRASRTPATGDPSRSSRRRCAYAIARSARRTGSCSASSWPRCSWAVFGGIALRIQRKELLLERELARQGDGEASDERLARADKLGDDGRVRDRHRARDRDAARRHRGASRDARPARRERTSAATRAAQAILEQTEKIRGIIAASSRSRAAKPPRSARALARASVVESATRMVEHRFAAAGVELDVAARAADVPAVFGEPRLLEQALVNLLLNACDASRGRPARARGCA